jgi:hypothetical protein
MKSTTYLTLALGTALTLPQAITSHPTSENSTLVSHAPAFIPEYDTSEAGNPFLPNYYATPDIAFYEGQYWVFVAPSPQKDRCFQFYFDAWSSPDMLNWTKHDKVLARETFHQEGQYHWAPCGYQSPASVSRDGKYYLYFGAGDPEHEVSSGIAVGVADRPEGPYRDPLNRALLYQGFGDWRGTRINDPSVLIDDDGQAYLYYGGKKPSYEAQAGRRLMMARLNKDMISIGEGWIGNEYQDDVGNEETKLRDVTPSQYNGGAKVFKRLGWYYMLWTEEDPDREDSRVAYGISSAPTGPWERMDVIMRKDDKLATGTGEASVVNVPGTDIHYLVYTRRQLGDYTDWFHYDKGTWFWQRNPVLPFMKRVAYERMDFDDEGRIKPVVMHLRDNFNDGNAEGWNPYTSGDFWVEGGKLWGRKGLAALNTNYFDVAAEADVTLAATEHDYGNAGLVVRLLPWLPNSPDAGEPWVPHPFDGPDDHDGTYAGISAQDGGKVVLGVAGGEHVGGQTGAIWTGRWYPLAEVSMPIEMGKSYHLRIMAEKDEVRVFVDDMDAPKIVSRCTEGGSPKGIPEQPFCLFREFNAKKGLPEVVWEPRRPDLIGNVGVRVFHATASFDNFGAAGL